MIVSPCHSPQEGWDGVEVATVFFSKPHLLILAFMLLLHPRPVPLPSRERGCFNFLNLKI